MVFISSNRLARSIVTHMRSGPFPDWNTTRSVNSPFHERARQVSDIMLAEMSGELPYKLHTATTTVEAAKVVEEVADESKILFVSLRRGADVMLERARRYWPKAQFGQITIHRDEETKEPIVDEIDLPEDLVGLTVIILDPMVATGGTSVKAAEIVHERGAEKMVHVGVLGAPEGVEKLRARFPSMAIYMTVVDPELTEKGWIKPGLGDWGDRCFGPHPIAVAREVAAAVQEKPQPLIGDPASAVSLPDLGIMTGALIDLSGEDVDPEVFAQAAMTASVVAARATAQEAVAAASGDDAPRPTA